MVIIIIKTPAAAANPSGPCTGLAWLTSSILFFLGPASIVDPSTEMAKLKLRYVSSRTRIDPCRDHFRSESANNILVLHRSRSIIDSIIISLRAGCGKVTVSGCHSGLTSHGGDISPTWQFPHLTHVLKRMWRMWQSFRKSPCGRVSPKSPRAT
jgi:hypothetical protein